MGFWSTLGKIGGIVGSAAAIPFTGGASAAAIPGLLGKISGIAGKVGDVASKIETGRAAERAQTNQLNQADYLNRVGQYNQENARTVANLNAVPDLYRRAMFGDVTSGMTPVRWDENGKLVGGISSDLFSQATRDAGKSMSADAVARMLSNNPIGLSNVPSLPAVSSPTGFDKGMNILGTIGGINDVLFPRKSATAPAGTPTQPAAGQTRTGVLDTAPHPMVTVQGRYGQIPETPAPPQVNPADVEAIARSGAIPWHKRGGVYPDYQE